LDLFVLLAYLVVVMSLGFYYSSSRDKTLKDYLLFGRNAGWVTVGFSIFATNISSEHFIGLAGSGASRGLVVGQFELMAVFILIAFGWFIAPVYYRAGIVTVPEFIEQRFDASIRKFFSGFSIVLYLFTKISVTLYAGGFLFNRLFGINIYTSAVIIVFITGLYSVIGGSAAVMRTHVFQTIVLIAGAVILTLFGLKEVGGITGLQQRLPSDYFSLFKNVSDPEYPWTGVIFGMPIIACWYWCADQYIVQRVLSAKSVNDARKGSLLAAALKILPILILVMPGLIAVALFPGIRGDEAYPVLLSSNILPSGLKGLVISGILAAVMSSLASAFNCTAALVTNDFFKPRHPEASERTLVLTARLVTTVIVFTAILCVPLVKLISSQVFIYLQSLQGFVSPPITAVFVFGMLFKSVNSKGVKWTLIIGESLGLILLVTGWMVDAGIINNPLICRAMQINFLHFTIILFAISSFVLLTVSRITQAGPALHSNKIYIEINQSLRLLWLEFRNRNLGLSEKKTFFFSIIILLVIACIWSFGY
jgi:SSS family solute:Na+ symporter